MDTAAPDIRLSEVISALSFALDITEGLPAGHSARTCAIGMRIAEAIELDGSARSSLFYALLLKDAGCSSNASRVAALFGADDRAVKRDRKLVDHTRVLPSLRNLVRSTRPGATPLERAAQLAAVVRHGPQGTRSLVTLRCERGAEIARMVDLDTATADAIRSLDEHWDGGGHPLGLQGEQIPLLGRILGLAQTIEVFLEDAGLDAAMRVARKRKGHWFDPALVDALESVAGDELFWTALTGGQPHLVAARFEPTDRVLVADGDRLDRVAEAFARVVDAKSPYTGRHSSGVAAISAAIAGSLGFDAVALRDLRRAALLHDVGKLGVSSLILDKPGKLDEQEWAQMRRHPELTVRILGRVDALRAIAEVAGAHHERLDGRGYHRGVTGERLSLPARILAVADVYEALTAQRPYRGPLSPEEALAIMRRDVPTALDANAFAALEGCALAPSFVAGLAPVTSPPAASAARGAPPARPAPR